MTRQASFHRLASEELGEAFNFYELESAGLGAAFLSLVERAPTQLEQFPESAPVVRGDIRKKPIGRFPYSLLFRIRGDEVRVLAVMHQSRRPFYWRGRR